MDKDIEYYLNLDWTLVEGTQNIYKTDYMQNVEMLKSTRFEQTGVENCGLYTVKTLAGGCVVGVNNVKMAYLCIVCICLKLRINR